MSVADGKPPAPKSAAEQAATAVGEDAPPPGISDSAAGAINNVANDRLLISPLHPPRRKGELKSEEVLDKQANRNLRRGLFPTDQSHKPDVAEDADQDKK